MSRFLDKAKILRAPTPPANCAQSVIIPFAQEAGLSEELAAKLTSHFKLGMRCGGVCGAVTGALMVLGLYGLDEGVIASQLYQRVRDNHQGHLNCPDLLQDCQASGCPQRQHCDGMVFECVGHVEELLKEHELIQ